MSTATINARAVRTAVASVTLIAATLTLAACNNDDADAGKRSGSAGSSAADSTGSDSTGSDSQSGDEQDAPAGGGAQDTGGKSGGGKDGGAAGGSNSKITTCDPGKMSMTVSKVSRPVNHMLLKATNNSGTTCSLVNWPALRFDDAQAATPVAEDTKPQALVTLAPGKSGYAGILTSSADGSGSNGTKVTDLSVFLKGSDAATSVSLPGGSVYIDDTAQVTYWQSDSSNAIDW
ncbi:DUF4232 domain-containing protein [Streptomyces sp. NPDC048636]|uniref:DUF4232 domain-containing protein n=1 Tax=Streptomyces sp. NPDC048636 TaxID=3155762 RepID=UPI00343EFAC8